MRIAIVGCGYVFDIYMRTFSAHPELTLVGVYDSNPDRMVAVTSHYGFRAYPSYDTMLADPSVETVINLTGIGSHYEVTRRALEAGKNVYTEKPITTSIDHTKELFSTAEKHGVRLYAAPCNIYSDTVRSLFEVVQSRTLGDPLLVYAELDDNPIHHMEFESVTSPTGAPWPLREEISYGCTYEHIGYHLVWICALLGPAVSISALSAELIRNKTDGINGYAGTPDYSVINLAFQSGAVARITCSVVAPRDHRMRIICRDGEITTDSYRQYRAPLFIERFSLRSLNARKFMSVRAHPELGRLFGVGGRKVRLATNAHTAAVKGKTPGRLSIRQRATETLRRRQVYAQDKFAGLAEMAREIEQQSPQYLSPDFLIHLNELTLLAQSAGVNGLATRPQTSFASLGPIPGTRWNTARGSAI